MSGYAASVCSRKIFVRFALLVTCASAIIFCPEKSRGQVVDFSGVVSKWESFVVPFEIKYTAARGADLPANMRNSNPGKGAAPSNSLPMNSTPLNASRTLTQQQVIGLVANASQPDSTFQTALILPTAEGGNAAVTLMTPTEFNDSLSVGLWNKNKKLEMQGVEVSVFDERIGTTTFKVNGGMDSAVKLAEELEPPGTPVVALWSSKDGQVVASHGIISTRPHFNKSLGREVVEVSAQVRPGAMGGAVINQDGELVGVILASVGLTPSVGTAVMLPVESVKAVLEAEQEKGTRVRGGALGVRLDDNDDGATLISVLPDSAAEEAGLKMGDTLVAIDGVEVNSQSEAIMQIRRLREGDDVDIRFRRGKGDDKDCSVRLQKAPASTLEPSYMLVETVQKLGDTHAGIARLFLQQLAGGGGEKGGKGGNGNFAVVQPASPAPKGPPVAQPTAPTSSAPRAARTARQLLQVAEAAAQNHRLADEALAELGIPNLQHRQIGDVAATPPFLNGNPRIEVERSNLEQSIRELSRQIKDLQEQLKESRKE